MIVVNHVASRTRTTRRLLLIATALTPIVAGSADAADLNITTNRTTPVILNQLLPGGGTVDIAAGVAVTQGIESQACPTGGGSGGGGCVGPAYTLSTAGTISN